MLKEISIETATTCNQRCTFCPVAVTRRQKNNLSLERLEKILSGIRPNQIEDIQIVGFYEPTYDKQLIEKISLIRKAGFNFSIFTNASGLKPELTNELIRLKVSRITINLSTLDEIEYETTRGTKDLKRIIPNLEYLLFQVRMQIQKPTIKIIILGALDQQHANNIQMITNKFYKYLDVLGFEISPYGDYAGDVKTKLVPRKQFYHQTLRGCAKEYQNERLYFNAQAEALLCCQDYFGQYKLGNIDESSVKQIHQSKNITKWRQWISGEEAPKDFICRSCLFALSDDNFVERLEKQFCQSCVLPTMLGVENSCHRCEVYSTTQHNMYIIDGHKMWLDDQDSLGLSSNNGIFEPQEIEIVKQEVKLGDTVLDIGANIGYYTLIFAKLVGEHGKVFAFEPDPNKFALLKKNVEMNGYTNVVLVPKAVSNENKIAKLYLCKQNQAMHRVYNSVFCNDSINIELLKLDDYFQQYSDNISFIKIDIEGNEYAAIEGMLNLLHKNRKVKLLTEFSPAVSLENKIDSKDYIKILVDLGFNIYSVDENIELVNIDKLYEQLIIVKEVVSDLFKEINAGSHKTSIEYLTSLLSKRLKSKNYTRPVFENFFCIR